MFKGILFLLGFGLAVVLLIATVWAAYRGRLAIRGFLFWIFAALVLGTLSLFPGIIDWLMVMISINVRGIFVLGVGLLLAYLFIYMNFLAQRGTEKAIRQISQELSLLRYRLEYGKEVHARRGDDRGIE